jgi:hypothetical protein
MKVTKRTLQREKKLEFRNTRASSSMWVDGTMSESNLLRAAERIAAENRSVIAAFENTSDPDLLAALAQRVGEASDGSTEIARMSVIDPDLLPRDNVTKALGKRILDRWSRTMHDFLCNSDEEDQDLRKRLLGAFTGKDGSATALLAGTMVAAFGASPAVAAVVAALLTRLVIAPARDEVCETWAKSLASVGTNT